MLVEVTHDLTALAVADTIVIPGWRDPREHPPRELLEALASAHARGARLVSICSGVFVLAALGIVDGRRITTHWRYVDLLAEMYPAVEIAANVLYVDDGDILTSAGSAAGLDLCLHIVRNDYGAEVANSVARRLVVAPHRDGGQAQYVPQPVAPIDTSSPSIAGVMEWALERIDRQLTVADLADRAMMAPRTFARRFTRETGTSPHEWIIRQRLHTARRFLETTDVPIERVATTSGFGSAETLRHHFRRAYATTPSGYRSRFALARSITSDVDSTRESLPW